ncbi:hypothetical protein NKH49_22740 [Mesorhizobium sp. M1088]|uniref:hypothetical protein n=1 Tax=unclassified Mesorhizobium TaxID=325217 RepID=UPI00333D431E
MTVQKEDYRTNRADFAIAAMHSRATPEGDRDDLVARKKALWVTDRRSAKLAANPSESSPEPKAKARGK